MTDQAGNGLSDRSDGDETQPDELSGDFGLSRTLEALLFVADRSLSAEDLGSVTEAPVPDIQNALEYLRDEHKDRGVVILEHRGSYRMVSAPDTAGVCRRLLGMEARTRLSRAALQTLAIIAYRQPVTRAQIEEIRGVDSDSALATLFGRELIQEVGRLEAPGRPVLFGTSEMFLAYFGITSLNALPEIDFPSVDTPSGQSPLEAELRDDSDSDPGGRPTA